MIEQLTQLVKQLGQEQVINNVEIPNSLNNNILTEATNSIFDGLQSTVAQGGIKQVMEIFGNSSNIQNNPITSAISNNFVKSIMEKFGINGNVATMIASALIPMVLSKLSSRANDPNDNGFSAGSILDSLTGGLMNQNQGGGIMDMVQKYGGALGLDKDSDGDVDLNDFIAQSSKAASKAQTNNSNIMDTIGSILGNLK